MKPKIIPAAPERELLQPTRLNHLSIGSASQDPWKCVAEILPSSGRAGQRGLRAYPRSHSYAAHEKAEVSS